MSENEIAKINSIKPDILKHISTHNIGHQIEYLKMEQERINSEIKLLEEKQAKTKQHIIDVMVLADISTVIAYGYRYTVKKTQGSIIVENEEEVSEEYKKEKVTVSVDKKKAKEFYKSNNVLPSGFKFEDGYTLIVTKCEGNQMDLTDFCAKQDEEEEL